MALSFTLTSKLKGLLVFAGMLSAVGLGFLFPSSAAAYGDTLYQGESLVDHGSLTSQGGQFTAVMQTDGNFVSYMPWVPYWAVGTNTAHSKIQMQTDGNLVIYRPNGTVAWASGTSDPQGAKLVLQNDGNLVIIGNSRGVLKGLDAVPTKLHSGQKLLGDHRIYSPDRRYMLMMQYDGNIVVYRNWTGGGVEWVANNPNRQSGSFLEMQTDANLVNYSTNRTPLWATNKFGPNGSYLEGQNDGNFVIYSPSRAVLWSTRDSGVTGSRAQLAQQVLDHPNISRPGRCVVDDLQRTARGEHTNTPLKAYLHADMLANTLKLASEKKIQITSITGCGSGHGTNSNHFKGTAIDIVPNTGNSLANIASTVFHNRGAWRINELIHNPMPSGTYTLRNGVQFTYDSETMNGHKGHVHHSVKP